MLIKRVHQLLHLFFAIFLLYLLLTRALITWVQVAPQQSIAFVEKLTDSEVHFEEIDLTQNLLGFRVVLDEITFQSRRYEFRAQKALVDINLFAWLWPSWSVGRELDIESGYLNRKDHLSGESANAAENGFNLQEMNLARLWQKIRLSDFVVSNLIYPDLTLHVNNLRSLTGAQLNLAAEFGLRYGKVLDFERFNLTASFVPSGWQGIGSGNLSVNSFSPLRFERVEALLPDSWSGVLPKGDMLLDAKIAVSQSQLSSVVLNVNGQSLDWRYSVNKVKNLPKSLGVELSWTLEHRNIHREFRDWRFQVAKMQLDNRFIETVSPLELFFDDQGVLHFEAKAVDIDPFKNMIKSAISNPHLYAMFDKAAEFSISDLHGMLNWKTLEIQALSVLIDKLTVPKTEFPSLALQNLQINKRPEGFEFSTNRPMWLVDTRIHPGAIRIDLPDKWHFSRKEDLWSLKNFKFGVDKIPFELNLQTDSAFSSLEASLGAKIKSMATVKQYLPYGFMSEPLQKWLSTALVDGRNIVLSSSLKGDPAQFPFTNGGGEFLVTGEVEKVKLKFDSKWPMIEDAKVRVNYRPHVLDIRTDRADLGNGVVAQKVVVKIPNLDQHDIAVNIQGDVSATMKQVADYLNRSPVGELTGLGPVLNRAQPLQGQADIRLSSIWVPVSGYEKADEKVKGRVRLDNVALQFHPKLKLSKINGSLDFSEKGADAESLRFQVMADRLQGSGSLKVATHSKTKQVVLAGDGVLQDVQRKLFGGTLPFSANMTIPFSAQKVPNLSLNVALASAKSLFPAPFDDAAMHNKSLKLNIGFAKQSIDLRASIASLFSVQGNWRKGKEDFQPYSLQVVVGSAAGTDNHKLQSGLKMSGNLNRLDFDQWRKFLEGSGLQSQFGGSGKGMDWRKSDLSIRVLTVKNHPLKDLALNWHSEKQKTVLNIRNDTLSGQLKFNGEEQLDVKVDRLVFVTAETEPKLAEKSVQQQCKKSAEDSLPWKQVNFVGEQISIDGRSIDQLNFQLKKKTSGYEVTDLQGSFGNRAGAITGKLSYDYALNQTVLDMAITSKNVAAVTKFLKLKNGFTGKNAEVRLVLNWLGELDCFSSTRAQGDIRFVLKDGVIEDVEPGFARLLGLLSVESLARRLQLDLKDVTNKGMVYDEIKGQAKLAKGFLNLNEFALKAPSANVGMQGKIDLQKELFDLRADVTPAVGSSLPTIAALVGAANPLTALAVYTLMKVLPGVNENLITYRFTINGPWLDPVIKQQEEKRSSVDFSNE
ncbi:AsmA-like C-terminal region-containing protein [Thiomicrorhabdus sp.]|uniref:YhdP family phospholipid transporter n=1 Tax=Thiomicrorhabdus sp. TaxID=2039724 RepID=UPI0029C8E315|nr:AsmA-like C-terminal region-containing protein [Thiomicrorhabdus sp.]